MNQFSLTGRLARDPLIKQTEKGSVGTFVLACDSRTEHVDFIRLTVFGKLADVVGKNLKKGAKVLATGRIHTGSYEKDGKKVYTTSMIASRVEFLAFPKDTAAPTSEDDVKAVYDGDDEMDKLVEIFGDAVQITEDDLDSKIPY